MIVVFWALSMVLMLLALVLGKIASGVPVDVALEQMSEVDGGGTPIHTLILFCSFSGIWVGVFTALSWLHKQRFRTIFSPVNAWAMHVRDFLMGAAITPLGILGYLIFGPILGIDAGTIERLMPFDQWILWVLPMLLLVFVQAAGEELIFRGYLLQQLAIRWRHWLVWALLPSLAFGALHYRDSETGLLYVITTTLMGLVFCALVWRTGALWAAVGFHVTNNAYALTIVSADPAVSATQLWVFPQANMAELLQVNLCVTVVILLLILSPVGRVFDR